MADLTKKMSPDNPTQILTTHDLSNLRALHSVTAAQAAAAQSTTATTPSIFGSNLINNHNNNNNNTSNNNSMVLSSIPLDGHALLIQQTASAAASATTSQHQQQQQATTAGTIVTSNNTNGLRATQINSLSNLLPKTGTIFSTTNPLNNSNKKIITTTNTGNMPTTSKYVFLQHNGQFTTYEGNTNSNGNIVLLATEPLELTSSSQSSLEQHQQQQHLITTSGGLVTTTTTAAANGQSGTGTVGDNDEELRPLQWLNNSNLIKDIVTSSSTNGGNNNNKRNFGNNICIVNASNAHELIEELPTHVAGEEHVATTNNTNTQSSIAPGDVIDTTQITTMTVSDFQQQFIANNNKRFGSIISSDQLKNNVAALGEATTTIHVGPSGTTTVVEYKSNSNFMPTAQQQRQLLTGNATTITATNLSNNNNTSYVPSSNVPSSSLSSSSLVGNQHVVVSSSTAYNTISKPISLPNTIVTTSSSSDANNMLGNNVANGNNNNNTTSTTNTIYQGHKQLQQQQQQNTTTHHPHKKYLREKMNVLDHGGGHHSSSSSSNNSTASAISPASNNNSIANNIINSGITIVSSPASSNNSLSSSSSSSTSSSTAAVNGGNSPISKSSYYTLGGSNSSSSVGASHTPASIAVNYSNSPSPMSTSSNAGGPASFIAVSSAPNGTATLLGNGTNNGLGLSTYTIVQHGANVVSSSALSSPDHSNTKEYYTLSTPQQQQHLQQHVMLRSPTSYSSYDNDSLKDFEVSTGSSSRLNASTPQHNHHQQQQQQQISPKTSPASSTNAHLNASINNNGSSGNLNTPQKQKHPNNVPYDPLVHTHNKPPYSFSSLIFMAIEGSNEKALPVKEIYAWIVQHFPYFKTAPTGWKNSVRHNLSLNKSFVKVEKAPNMGKGSLWRVEQMQRQNLIQALTRSPFFPNSAVDKINLKNPSSIVSNLNSGYDVIDGIASSKTTSSNNSHINARFDPHLFPRLSKVFKDMDNDELSDVIPDVADDDIPSDYSTSGKSKYDFISASNHQNGSDAINNNNNHNNNNGSTIIGNFTNYESIEHLARDCGADNIDDVNAATAMLALKHGPKVFSENFQNGAPVITSSPSEDHTYSAGGSNAGSGASTPLTNGAAGAIPLLNSSSNGINVPAAAAQNGCDNQSNCASSDAAYESSEENHNISPEELEDRQRQRDGVDALLSLSLSSSIVDHSSSSCSPIKRPSSTSVEEEHITSTACLEQNNSSNIMPLSQQQISTHHKMAMLSNAAAVFASSAVPHHHGHHSSSSLILDEGYNTQSYYGSNLHLHHHHSIHHHLSTASSTPKKPKPLRSLRTKIKRKAPWMR